MTDVATTAPVTITLAVSAEVPFTEKVDMLVRVMNDHDTLTSKWATTPTINLTVPFHDNGEEYRVVVHVRGYKDAGGFFKPDPTVHKTVTLPMIPDHATPRFPAWLDLKTRYPATAKLIAGGVDDAEAEARYDLLGKERPLSLASLMNLSAAMGLLQLGGGKTPMDFIKEVIWDVTLAQDRFFGYADPAILPLVRAAAADDEFAQEGSCKLFHKGSTCSYKQTEFDYSDTLVVLALNDDCLMWQVPNPAVSKLTR